MSDTITTQVAVLGGGPGGYAAAFAAADLGLKVALVETEPNPGGVCLYRGCIPSKTLLHVAKVISEAREGAEWGVKFSKPRIDLDTLRARKNAVVAKMTGGLGQLSKARNITYLQGRGSFEDSQTLKIVNEKSGAHQTLHTEHTILATGSRPATLPNLYLESDRLMNSSTALELEDIPKSLLVVGGGYIGLELGSVYAALGTKVTVVEMTPGLLPGADADLVKVLHGRMEESLHEVLLSTKVMEIAEVSNGLRVKLKPAKGRMRQRTFEKVLVSIGRKPNSSGIGLRNTKAEKDDKNFVKVDAQRRTSDPHIYAIGDVAGEPMLAHKASHEGRVAAEVIAGQKVAFEPAAIPAVVFTDPEVAWCGITESEAKAQDLNVDIARFPWGASGRATTIGRDDGLTKIISDPDSGRILGMGIVGSGAGELIGEGVLAVEMAATALDVGHSIHAHPTLSETLMESAEMIFGHGTHVYRPKKK
jgi:dihydrolipoamide dehydrogenase